MPDVFVPLDTMELSPMYRKISRKGIINTFTFDYVDKNRDMLKAKYSDFETYKNDVITTPELMKEFWSVCEAEGIEYNEKDYETSKHLIQTLIKARMASNLWDFSKFYPIYNAGENEIYIKALELIDGKYIDKLKLDF